MLLNIINYLVVYKKKLFSYQDEKYIFRSYKPINFGLFGRDS